MRSFFSLSPTECKDKQVIDLGNEPSGAIHVINFTSTYYKGDIYCLWRFEAPSTQKVLIYFTFFDMGSSYCSFASVTISEEPRFGEREILMEACGYKTPRAVITSEGLAELTFHSRWFQKGRGFVAHYKVLNSTTGRLIRTTIQMRITCVTSLKHSAC